MTTGDMRGYIQYQIGHSLVAMEAAIADDNLPRFANLVRFFVAKAVPVLEDNKAKALKAMFPTLREFHHMPEWEQAGAFTERYSLIVERTLFELREKGYYAFGKEEEAGDASGAAITDEDPPEE